MSNNKPISIDEILSSPIGKEFSIEQRDDVCRSYGYVIYNGHTIINKDKNIIVVHLQECNSTDTMELYVSDYNIWWRLWEEHCNEFYPWIVEMIPKNEVENCKIGWPYFVQFKDDAIPYCHVGDYTHDVNGWQLKITYYITDEEDNSVKCFKTLYLDEYNKTWRMFPKIPRIDDVERYPWDE